MNRHAALPALQRIADLPHSITASSHLGEQPEKRKAVPTLGQMLRAKLAEQEHRPRSDQEGSSFGEQLRRKLAQSGTNGVRP